MSPPRCDEGTIDEGDHTPVKGQEAHTEACLISKELVHNNIARGDPTNPVEDAECGEDVAREPEPKEASKHGEDKELLARNMLRLALAVISVKSVEKGGIYECARPEHARWPDKELANNASEGETKELRAQTQKDLIAKAPMLGEINFLRRDDVCRIHATGDDVGHNGDHSVFFNVEGPRVERPGKAESVEACRGKDVFEEFADRKRNKLDNKTRNKNRWI